LHELKGTLHLIRGEYPEAISELEQSNLLDPYNLYRLGMAYVCAGEKDKARMWTQKTVNFNVLNNLNYAMVRSKAKQSFRNLN
jgi:sulfur relay (sulfurtransferase) DsrF/TusC family protein